MSRFPPSLPLSTHAQAIIEYLNLSNRYDAQVSDNNLQRAVRTTLAIFWISSRLTKQAIQESNPQ